MKYNIEKLKNGLNKLNIEPNDKVIDQFILYYEMLVEKNKFL